MMLGTGTLTTGGNNTSTTYTGIVSGTGGLTKAGTGVFTLSGANTYTGATTINAGTPARTRCFRPSTGSSAH
jgi:autotransporter-associated beta strand protein